MCYLPFFSSTTSDNGKKMATEKLKSRWATETLPKQPGLPCPGQNCQCLCRRWHDVHAVVSIANICQSNGILSYFYFSPFAGRCCPPGFLYPPSPCLSHMLCTIYAFHRKLETHIFLFSFSLIKTTGEGLKKKSSNEIWTDFLCILTHPVTPLSHKAHWFLMP